MKATQTTLITLLTLVIFCSLRSGAIAGFFLPDSLKELTLRYRTLNNLIVLPVTLNNSVSVNLILDTGTRNLVLFGKRFLKQFDLHPDKKVQFSGLGSGGVVMGQLSLDNTVSIGAVLGRQIPVVLVSDKNLFSSYRDIHGVIGYEIFLMFEIEMNPREKTITFRPAATAHAPSGFSRVPLRVVDARPVVSSSLLVDQRNQQDYDIMIDTGSSLGLLIKTTDISLFQVFREQVLGYGFNGPMSGYETIANRLTLDGVEFRNLPTGIVPSSWHNYGSIGMKVLKDYIVVINYCKAYACFRRLDKEA